MQKSSANTNPFSGDQLFADSVLTPAEVAKLLRVPKTWVYSHQSEIPGYLRLGRYVRFRKAALVSFLTSAGVTC